MSRTIEEMALNSAAQDLIQEWNKPEWCEQLEKKVEDLAALIAERRRVEKERLLMEAKRLDPYIGKHYGRML